MFNSRSFFFIIFTVVAIHVQAQTTQKNTKQTAITTVVKFKPPVVQTYLGRNAKEATITVEEANQLINLPLKITDDKGANYTISSYQFMYKKRSIIENEETGRKEVAYTTVADRFNTSPLPKIWKENIGGGLQKDEELYFFDVIVNDSQNRKFFAPNLKIKIK